MTIVEPIMEFLLARIAEDEAFVAHDAECRCPENDPPRPDCGARIQAECAAKRRIVEVYTDELSRALAYRNPRWADAMNEQDKANHRLQEARLGTGEVTVRILAAVYADHPDFDPAWRV